MGYVDSNQSALDNVNWPCSLKTALSMEDAYDHTCHVLEHNQASFNLKLVNVIDECLTLSALPYPSLG